MMRPPEAGMRSLIRTTTERPVRGHVTRTSAFIGSVGCAAVSVFMSKISPLAVGNP